ncbi:protein rotatin homolog isoform X2 [Eurosta solidaginis]|uniref:protein rotatin homolog isoform X2 n=1 Tax=Eurosta solidaginis TaxID=178769 RepID=UPI0035308CD6
MTLELDNETIKKLSHESSEIRLRSLDQIFNKLSRALEHKEQLNFKAGELCKQLIRWFAFEPLNSSKCVLQLLKLILSSSYGDQAIRRIGIERFKKEMEKVKLRVKNQTSESKVVEEIIRILNEYQFQHQQIEPDIIEVLDTLSLNTSDEVDNSKSDMLLNCCDPSDYEPAWSRPVVADFTALQFLSDILSNDNKVEMTNALLHFEVTMQDYPAEFMLQAPHVFLKLLNLYRFHDNIESSSHTLQDIARQINVYLHVLLKRLKVRYNIYAYSADATISESQGNTQLKVAKVLELIFDKSVHLLETLVLEFHKVTQQILEVMANCMEIYRYHELAIDMNVITKLHRTLVRLQKCFEKDEHFTLERIKYLLLVCLLDDILIHNSKVQSNSFNSEVLECVLQDFTFKANFPQRYKNIERRVCEGVAAASERYRKLKLFDNSIRFAISLFKNPQDIESRDIIMNGIDIGVALDNLKSVQLAERIFNAIIDCNTQYLSKPALRAKANQVLLNLLRLKYEPLKEYIYKMIVMSVKRHFACLMECERYCIGLTHGQLLESQVFGIPLSSELLLQLVYECGESSEEKIRKFCEETITLILKSQNLLGEHWTKLLQLVIPILPLLQCCTQSQEMIELLQNLYHPDAKQIPFLASLQGNLAYMFYDASVVRSEALTRLIYMLNSVQDADKYVPNLLYISDVIPNDLCILKTPREYKRIFADVDTFYESSTMQNLLNMLEMSDVEPIIRKTTLMQLNVMCQQWHTLAAFCEENALYLILRALENSLLVATYEDYTGAAIPAIGILSKVLLYDASLRRELADTPNIYFLLFRALCLYQNDIQLRQDACICLFLLLYSSFLIVLGNQRIEAPKLLGNLKLPLNCDLKSFEQSNESNTDYENLFKSKTDATLYMRYLLADSFNADKQIWVTKQYLEQPKDYDFDPNLRLTLRDWRLMKATNSKYTIQRFLCAILNATDHRTLINASISLQLQFLVRDESSDTIMCDKLTDELYNLICKYLQLPPGNESDYALFEELLDLCDLCVRLPLPHICRRLAMDLVTDFHHAMIVLLKNDDASLRLYNKLCLLLEGVVVAVKSLNGIGDGLCILYTNLFELNFELITNFFLKRDLLRIRCLLRLQKVLSANAMTISDEKLIAYSKRLIKLSLAVKSFTQTGAQWQIACLTIVCQLHSQFKEPSHNFKLKNSTVKYLSGLCGHCDRQVRALAWCVLTYASCYVDQDNPLVTGVDLLMNELSYLPGGFMACCLSTLLDVGETIVVRQLAANLFISFLNDVEKCGEAYQLLTRHRFLEFADASVRENCLFEQQYPIHNHNECKTTMTHVTSCDLVSCFCRICLRMTQIRGDFINELCECDFMQRLYEIFKNPPAYTNPAYYIMCGDVCHLYGVCYPEKFYFLQRTLCRDHVWLMSFYQLLDQPLASDAVLVNILQLLMVLCKDDLAYEKLCQKFAKAPEFLIKHFLRAFTIDKLNTPLQRSSLAALSLLLIKAKSNNQIKSFVAQLEENVERTKTTKTYSDKLTLHRTYKNDIPTGKQCDEINERLSGSKLAPIYDDKPEYKSAAAIIFVELFRLFQHIYSITARKFDTAPNKAQVQYIF